jgi:DNA modification methylase
MKEERRSDSQPLPTPALSEAALTAVAEAALDRQPVSGSTHNFYRYPARFSPRFAAAVIEHFSRPGDFIADPYMGGGTAVVEALVAGRRVVGNDLNSLATFITKVKITRLTPAEVATLREWVLRDVPGFGYRTPSEDLAPFIDPIKTKNLSLAKARFIKKAVAAALASIEELASTNARDFARCVLLRVSQWALDGRERHTPLAAFRDKLAITTEEMLLAIETLTDRVDRSGGHATLLNVNAAMLDREPIFREPTNQVKLVLTSPPYPGVHVLYHRWQVDGRRETPAPYWIAGCNDGNGASFYNFGDRRQEAADNYFRTSLLTLQSIRRIMAHGAFIVQMVAFNRPDDQLPRYLANMQAAGFEEAATGKHERIWRQVPHRKWHARLKGITHSANEVVLVHRAV